MYVLGIETATPVAAVAVAGDEGILAERMVRNNRTHSVNLLPMIKAVFEESEVDRAHLSGIAVSAGPGSFTGIRIGMSTAKALAQVWELPLVKISTLEALAYPLSGHGRLICPILNARKNEVYTALYDFSGSARECIAGPAALKPEELVQIIKTVRRPVTLIGDGVPAYFSVIKNGLEDLVFTAAQSASFPRGAAVAEMGLDALRSGLGCEPAAVLPDYIRPSEAEVVWLKKQSSGG